MQVANAAAPEDGPVAHGSGAYSGSASAAAAGTSAAQQPPRRMAPSRASSSGAASSGASRRASAAGGRLSSSSEGGGEHATLAGEAAGQAPPVRVMEGVQENAFRRCECRLN